MLILPLLMTACQKQEHEVFAVRLSDEPVRTAALTSDCAPARLHPAETKIDINHASAAQLMQLPGMNARLAKEIISGRPYRSKRELLRRHLLTAVEYQQLTDRLIAHWSR